MGISPMGFYLRRGSDGAWIGAVSGRENFQPSQEYRAADRPAWSGGDVDRVPWWVKLIDNLRHGLAGPSDRDA
jgi:hypothetical protein